MAFQTRRKIPRIPKARHADVTRDEFNRAVEMLNQRSAIIEEHAAMLVGVRHDLDVQFKRIAQLQQEIETLKKMLERLSVA